MILIYSINNDTSTASVCKWLDYFNKLYYVLTFDKLINNNIELTVTNNILKIKDYNTEIILSEQNIDGIWFRKYSIDSGKFAEELINTHPSLNKYLRLELYHLFTGLFDFFYKKKHLGNFDERVSNKIYQLKTALSVGLEIPDTIISNTLNTLKAIKHNIITKSINNPPNFIIENQLFSTFTSRIEDFTKLSETFLPSLVQNEISKLFEIRIFYIDKKFFSSAIFSQSDKQTMVDLRNYNNKKPNRVVPYLLPIPICEKIIMLFEKLNINTGSIDMIKGCDNKYYFLEVNPSGIFEEYSNNCNYYLEKEIALYFSEKL